MMIALLLQVLLLLLAGGSPGAAGSSEGLFVRDGRGVLFGPYASSEEAYATAGESGQVVCLDARPVPVGRAVAPENSGAWFVRCPDGAIRGPYASEAMRQWLVAQQISPSAVCFAGRLAVRADEPDKWKSTWLKHLRPHRWRATRATVKLGKSAAKKSVSAVATVAPIVRTWEDEEAEWAALVAKANAVQRRPKPPRPVAPPPRPPRPPRARPARRFRSVDASKQLDPSAAWRDDARAALAKQLRTVALVLGLALVAALLLTLAPLDALPRLAPSSLAAAVAEARHFAAQRLATAHWRIGDALAPLSRRAASSASDLLRRLFLGHPGFPAPNYDEVL